MIIHSTHQTTRSELRHCTLLTFDMASQRDASLNQCPQTVPHFGGRKSPGFFTCIHTWKMRAAPEQPRCVKVTRGDWQHVPHQTGRIKILLAQQPLHGKWQQSYWGPT